MTRESVGVEESGVRVVSAPGTAPLAVGTGAVADAGRRDSGATGSSVASGNGEALTGAFEAFSRASHSLEQAYDGLRLRVTDLSERLRKTEGDLRESREANRRLQELAERRSRLEAMGRMAAEITHELRNPLGSLELTTCLLRDELMHDPAKRELALSILDGLRALTRVTANLLDFTRSITPRLERLEAAACLNRTRALVGPACAARGVTLELCAAPDLVMNADPELVQQILLNLIQNGLEAIEPPGTVVMSAVGSADGGVDILVKDTGRGMDEETLGRVFDPFFTTRERGTGLGLSVSHRLAEAQGARLELNSRTGKGTTATLSFPPVWQEEIGC